MIRELSEAYWSSNILRVHRLRIYDIVHEDKDFGRLHYGVILPIISELQYYPGDLGEQNL